jgi:SRSO17 transposase
MIRQEVDVAQDFSEIVKLVHKKRQNIRMGSNHTTHGVCLMFKIARFPKKLNKFFDSLANEFHWEHHRYFKEIVLLIGFSFGRKNVASLYRHMDAENHRTRYNNFLEKARWDPEVLLRQKAMEMLKTMKPKPDETIYLVIDDSKSKKRGKKMEAIGKIFDTSSQTFAKGHQYVVAVLRFRDVTIPFGIRMYVNKKNCKRLGREFRKQTELAGDLISEFKPPEGIKTLVLFDAFYMNKQVVNVCRSMDYHFISVLSANRNLYKGGRKLKVGSYGRNLFHRFRSKKSRTGKNQYIEEGWIDTNSVGRVRLLFSKKYSERQVVTLATDDPSLSAYKILKSYENRWSIEVFFKDAKQHLGLGQYQNGSLTAAVNHLHLVCFAYSLLTHLSFGKHGAKGTKHGASRASTVTLQNQLRKLVWNDLVNHLKKRDPDTMIKELNRLLVAA